MAGLQLWVPGCSFAAGMGSVADPNMTNVSAAVAIAKAAKVVVAIMGIDGSQEVRRSAISL